MYGVQYGYDSNYYKDDNRYGYDNNHPKKSSHLDIQKIKCVNSNTNINGIDITEIPTDDLATAETTTEGADATGAQNGNGWGDRINFERNLVNICVNSNQNEQVKTGISDEEPTTAKLIVTKTTTCDREEFGDFCNFNPQITVTGNNPQPSSFVANDTPKTVTLGEGLFSVNEAGFTFGQQPCLSRGFQGGQIIGQNVLVCTNFDDSCSEDIRAGQELSCTIENTVQSLSGGT
jgi:hypothetical protein